MLDPNYSFNYLNDLPYDMIDYDLYNYLNDDDYENNDYHDDNYDDSWVSFTQFIESIFVFLNE